MTVTHYQDKETQHTHFIVHNRYSLGWPTNSNSDFSIFFPISVTTNFVLACGYQLLHATDKAQRGRNVHLAVE